MSSIVIVPIIFASVLITLFRMANRKYNPPIFGVYQRRNKYFWIKFVFMYIFLRLKQLYIHVRGLLVVELGYSFDGTVHIHEDDVALEQKYEIKNHPQAVDSVYFNGVAKDGVAVISSVARRTDDYVDAFMYLKINGDLLLSPELPDTRLQQSTEEKEEYKVGSIDLSSVIPMRSWKVSYYGDMKYKGKPEKTANIKMDLTWSAHWPAFNYDVHISPLTMAEDLAREQWSTDYFKLLKKFHQTHYEQMGFLTGSVFVDDKKHLINMPCVRNHTVGQRREWRNIHRYVLHYVYLENGDCIVIGAVSQPIFISHITIGYLCRKSDQAVLPVKWCDFKLWQHGENQTLPKDYAFTFSAGGERHDVRVKVNDEDVFYVGETRESKVYERWATVEVNGVKGWGCLEWQYNNVTPAIKQ